MLGNGASGEWQRENALGDLDHFVGAVKAMDPNWRAAPQDLGGQAAAGKGTFKAVHYETGYVMEGRQAGSAMFTKLCAGCHSIGGGLTGLRRKCPPQASSPTGWIGPD